MGIRARSSLYLLSTGASAALSLLTLPLTTRIIGPHEYGVLALGTVIAAIGVPLATMGIPFVVNSRWRHADDEDRPALATTLLALGTALAGVYALATAVVFVALRDHLSFLREIPIEGMALLLGGTVLAPLWTIAGEMLAVTGRAAFFAVSTFAQSVAAATATLVALYAFDLGGLALFVGSFAMALTGGGAAFIVLRPFLRRTLSSEVARDAAHPRFFGAQLSGSAYPLVEGTLLSRFAGFAELALYIHAQRYRGLVFQGTKAVSRGVWPVTLDESRDLDGRFPTTRRTWAPMHVLIAAVGVALVAVGDYLIALLTNDKFTEAYVYLGPWFILLLLQFTTRPETAVVYTLGRGRTLAGLEVSANLAGITAAVILIPFLGAWGALGALLVHGLVYRSAIMVAARRLRAIPFQDEWAFLGIGLVGVATAVKLLAVDGLAGSLLLLVAGDLVCLAAVLRTLGRGGPLAFSRVAGNVSEGA